MRRRRTAGAGTGEVLSQGGQVWCKRGRTAGRRAGPSLSATDVAAYGVRLNRVRTGAGVAMASPIS